MRKSHSQSDADREKCSHLSYISSRAKGLPTLGMGTGTRHNRGSPMSECQSHSQSCRNSPNRIVRHRVCSPVDRWWTRAPCYVTTTSFRGRPKKPRPHTGTTQSHTHTHYMESTTETLSVPCVGGRPHPPFAQILRASSPKDSNASPNESFAGILALWDCF
jgi:hypothetical protein